jgi:hypothetical protein
MILDERFEINWRIFKFDQGEPQLPLDGLQLCWQLAGCHHTQFYLQEHHTFKINFYFPTQILYLTTEHLVH